MMIICSLAAFLLYANTLHHDYALDDETAIVKNKFTHEGLSALPKIFSTPYRAGFDDRREGLYRPLSIAMFAAEWQISPGNPYLNHWVNVLLYALTAVLLFITLALLFEGQNIALPFVATLIFTAHPIHTEVVANIKSRDEILCFLFSLVSLWAALNYAKQQRNIYLIVSGISLLLALLSKETAITLVILAPLTVYFFSQASMRKVVLSAIPFIAASAIYIAVRISVLKGLTNFDEIQIINNSLVAANDNVTTRFATAISIVGRYLWLMVVPHPLSFDYSYNSIPLVPLSDPKALLSLAAIIALAVIAIRGLKTKDPVAWGILFFGGTLVLVTNILFLIEATLGERFLYMPSLGFAVAITFLLARIFKTTGKAHSYKNFPAFISANKNILAFIAMLLVLYATKTIARNADWKDDLTLTKHDVTINPNSVRIRYAYGSELVMVHGLKEKDAGKKKEFMEEGIRQLTAAVTILPDYGDAWFNLGMAYKESEDYKNAIRCFDNAQKFTVEESAAYYIASGVAYGEDGQYNKAFELLKKAIQMDSSSADAYNNIGMFYSRAGNNPLSLQMLKKAMELDPKNDIAAYNMGNTYAGMGDYNAAIEFYKKSLAINPVSEIAWINLGNCYGALKDYPNAIAAFKKTLEMYPSSQNALYNLGVTYTMMGDTANAKKYMTGNH